jgi:hypothetical protein
VKPDDVLMNLYACSEALMRADEAARGDAILTARIREIAKDVARTIGKVVTGRVEQLGDVGS